MLVDDVVITIKAGNGGDGSAKLKRNAQTAKGGPDGGNGGNGGNVYFQGSHDLSDLSEFRYKKKMQADNGVNGREKNLYGKNADHLVIMVPLGTHITDATTGKTFEMRNAETKALLALGGKGGRGNNEFKSATNQTPRFAEDGGKGEEKVIRLELRLIADIGIIGLPNAGKSSLLKALTHATPKIGAYPFTTLEPNLGVLHTVVLADIPGLIEGASKGKGLGIQFLKHIQKTKLLIHCLDVTSEDKEKSYTVVRNEFRQYNESIQQKPEIILLTKTDLASEHQITNAIKVLQGKNALIKTISVIDDKSVADFKKFLLEYAQSLKKPKVKKTP